MLLTIEYLGALLGIGVVMALVMALLGLWLDAD